MCFLSFSSFIPVACRAQVIQTSNSFPKIHEREKKKFLLIFQFDVCL